MRLHRKAKHAGSPSTRPGAEPTGEHTGGRAGGTEDTGHTDRAVLYCRDVELIVEGRGVTLVGLEGQYLRLPLHWFVQAESRDHPEAEAIQLSLHFAPLISGIGVEHPVLMVVRVFVDRPYRREAEEMLSRLRKSAPQRAPERQIPPGKDVRPEGREPVEERGLSGLEPIALSQEQSPARSAPWFAPQAPEWATFAPLPATTEVRDDLIKWAQAPTPEQSNRL